MIHVDACVSTHGPHATPRAPQTLHTHRKKKKKKRDREDYEAAGASAGADHHSHADAAAAAAATGQEQGEGGEGGKGDAAAATAAAPKDDGLTATQRRHLEKLRERVRVCSMWWAGRLGCPLGCCTARPIPSIICAHPPAPHQPTDHPNL